MTKFFNLCFLYFAIFINWGHATAGNLDTPPTISESLPNGVIATTSYKSRSNSLAKYIKATTLKRGRVTLSYSREGWTLDEIGPVAKNVQIKTANKKLTLPDAPLGISAKEVRWLAGDYILVPGMSYGGNAHEQTNDTAVVSIDNDKIRYLGMVTTWSLEKTSNPNYLYAYFAAFDFSPYIGSHADGIGISVALKLSKKNLIPDLEKTNALNQPQLLYSSKELNALLSDSIDQSLSMPRKECINESGQTKYCDQKARILHFALMQATLLRYTDDNDRLNDLIEKIKKSPFITSEDVDEFKNFVSFEPGTTNFLFWRKPSNWFIKDEDI